MRKGKFGIAYSFYAVAAVVLAMFGQIWLAGAITLFVIALDNDEWTVRQGMAAVALSLVGSIFSEIIYLLKLPMDWVADFVRAESFYNAHNIYDSCLNITSDVVDILILIFFIIAAFRVAKSQEAGLPFGSKFANWAYGKVVPKAVAPQPMQQPAYQQPMMQQSVQQPVYQQPMMQAQANKFCPKCGSAVQGSFCQKCGTRM